MRHRDGNTDNSSHSSDSSRALEHDGLYEQSSSASSDSDDVDAAADRRACRLGAKRRRADSDYDCAADHRGCPRYRTADEASRGRAERCLAEALRQVDGEGGVDNEASRAAASRSERILAEAMQQVDSERGAVTEASRAAASRSERLLAEAMQQVDSERGAVTEETHRAAVCQHDDVAQREVTCRLASMLATPDDNADDEGLAAGRENLLIPRHIADQGLVSSSAGAHVTFLVRR